MSQLIAATGVGEHLLSAECPNSLSVRRALGDVAFFSLIREGEFLKIIINSDAVSIHGK